MLRLEENNYVNLARALILHLKGETNVEIQLKHNSQKTVAHANGLKSFFAASQNLAVFSTSSTNYTYLQMHLYFISLQHAL
jgi:hypothetical protein